MKNLQSCVLAAALLLAAAAPLAAQRGQQRSVDRVQRNPIEILLDNRTELDLTDEQVARLNAINERLTEENRAVVEELREVRGRSRPSNRQEAERLRESGRASGKEGVGVSEVGG